VSQVNRATSETLRQQATQEGLVPLKNWIKSALDRVIQVCMNEPGLEFVWVGDDAVDPLEQAQPPESPRPTESAPGTPTEFSLEEIANGKFPGVAKSLGDPRTMPASDDPGSEADKFIRGLTTGRAYAPVKTDLDAQGGYVIQLDDGTYITYPPPGVSSEDPDPTTASVDINSPQIRAMNSGKRLKFKFPKK
jgi:hypothetical protein